MKAKVWKNSIWKSTQCYRYFISCHTTIANTTKNELFFVKYTRWKYLIYIFATDMGIYRLIILILLGAFTLQVKAQEEFIPVAHSYDITRCCKMTEKGSFGSWQTGKTVVWWDYRKRIYVIVRKYYFRKILL